MKTQKNVFLLGVSLFAFFPLLPNKIKGLPVILLFLISLFILFKNKQRQFNFKKIILFSSLYILYLFSLIYTDNYHGIDKTLTTRLSLIIVPLAFGILSSYIKTIELEQILFFQKLYFLVTVIYSLLILLYSYQLGYFSNEIEINFLYAYITYEMYSINQHPIYASILISIAIVFGFNLLFSKENKRIKIIIAIGVFLLIFMLFFLSRKGVLLALFFALMMYFFLKKTYFIKFTIILILGLIIVIFSTTNNRFIEVFKKNTYETIKEENSSSIRFGIYKCALNEIRENIIFGVGIGDVKDKLGNCYKETSEILLKGNYNTHNQYFSIVLSNGAVGIIVFLFYLFFNFKIAFKEQNVVFISLLVFYSIIMLFENILERQSGLILFSFLINFFAFIKVDKQLNE